MHSREFGQFCYKDLLKRIVKKFILYFFIFNPFSMYFRSIKEFLDIFKLKNDFEI
jgi:exonuclease V gamma subunit